MEVSLENLIILKGIILNHDQVNNLRKKCAWSKASGPSPHRGDLRAHLGGDPRGVCDLRRGRVSEQTPPLLAVARPPNPPAHMLTGEQSGAPPFHWRPPLSWLSVRGCAI